MKKLTTLLLVTAISFLNYAAAQNCPTLSVSSPAIVKEGETAAFTAVIKGGNYNPTYNWSISAGTIESGQGTSNIMVNTNGVGGQTITATLELGGLPRECNGVSSASTSVDAVPRAELHTKGDYTTAKLFTTGANDFAGAIMSGDYIVLSPKAVIYLYPGKNAATAAAAIKEMTKALKTAFAKYGVTSSMYKIITAAKRPQTSYEMWIVPEGAKSPEATAGE